VDLFFGSTNGGKLRELRRLVSGLPVRLVSPGDLGRPLPDVEEDGLTFRANAEKKASAYARLTGLHALADDSGLGVDALEGAPGVHSARWSELDDGLASPVCAPAGAAEHRPDLGRAARDEANNDKLLAVLSGVPDSLRGAAYAAALALARPDGTIAAQAEGSCRGRIGRARRGAGGFGYDPLFLPDGKRGRSMAELDPAEKDALSHRGAAFRALRPALERLAFDNRGV
jgi:XTP/dITP diphosphohydrolase